jgi:hypothetical protein
VGRDLPLILHKTAARILVAYVDHHDAAYAWAERRRIEAHPRTGAIQIVEVRERVAAAQPDLARLWTDAPAPTVSEASPAAPAPLLFENLDRKRCWRWASRSTGSNRSSTPPNSASSTLATTCPPRRRKRFWTTPRPVSCTGPSQRPPPPTRSKHPDARRRIFTVESTDELRAALDAPWYRWSVFLHPSQRAVVERSFTGPARVAGSAGTGKTVVAVHRAVRIIRSDTSARVLLTTSSAIIGRGYGREPRPRYFLSAV